MFRFVHLFGFSANVPSLSSDNRPIRYLGVCPVQGADSSPVASACRRNWLRFARLSLQELGLFRVFWPSGTGTGDPGGRRTCLPAPGKLAFLHNWPDRRHRQSCRSRPFLSVQKLALFRRSPAGRRLLCSWGQIGFVLHNRSSHLKSVPNPQSAIRNPKSAIGRLALFRTMGPRPPLASNIRLHTSDFFYLYASPYYPPCCRNLSKKVDCATCRYRRKSLS